MKGIGLNLAAALVLGDANTREGLAGFAGALLRSRGSEETCSRSTRSYPRRRMPTRPPDPASCSRPAFRQIVIPRRPNRRSETAVCMRSYLLRVQEKAQIQRHL